MKRILWMCCLTFLTTPLFAVVVVDTLGLDSIQKERLNQYLDSVFVRKEDATPRHAQLEKPKLKKAKKDLYILKLSGGVSLLTSKVEVGDKTYSFQPGLEYMLEFEHISDNGNGNGSGFGFVFKGNRTYINGAHSMNLYHFGVNYIWCSFPPPNKRWRWEAAVGVGASLFDDKTDWNRAGYYLISKKKFVGLGVLLKVGGEYRITKHFGLGLEMNNFLHVFFDSELKAQREKTLLNGFETSSLTLGLRFYLGK